LLFVGAEWDEAAQVYRDVLDQMNLDWAVEEVALLILQSLVSK
jgi:hypothetical protein